MFTYTANYRVRSVSVVFKLIIGMLEFIAVKLRLVDTVRIFVSRNFKLVIFFLYFSIAIAMDNCISLVRIAINVGNRIIGNVARNDYAISVKINYNISVRICAFLTFA